MTMSVKQVIVIRRDLKMRRGKEVAQGSHAALGFLLENYRAEEDVLSLRLSAVEKNWLQAGQRKICVRVNSEEELLAIHQKARESGLKSTLIRDSGKTEFGGNPTYTCCAVGPDEAVRIDAVTAHLELM